jgi:hypothetical protein
MEVKVIEGSCHCGAVSFTYPRLPDWLTECNCSVCRRYSTLWAYARVNEITISSADDATVAYIHGDKTLAMHSCKTCGCTTHWIGLDGDESSKMAVNFRMCDPDAFTNIRVRKFDGADTWEFLD